LTQGIIAVNPTVVEVPVLVLACALSSTDCLFFESFDFIFLLNQNVLCLCSDQREFSHDLLHFGFKVLVSRSQLAQVYFLVSHGLLCVFELSKQLFLHINIVEHFLL
jgi:hypothetical protein